MAPDHRHPIVSAILALGLAGCTAGVSSDPGDDAPEGMKPDNLERLPESCRASGISPGPSPVRRLSHFEYDNTVRDLLGEDPRLAAQFPADTMVRGLDNDAEALLVSGALADNYQSAAAELAARAIARLDRIAPCDVAATGAEECARRLIANFGHRAFRRPLADDERARYFALYAADAQGTHAEKLQLVLEALLQSPFFLYRAEFGAGGTGIVATTAWETASRLSYLLWASMPDDALFAAAASGELGTPAGLGAQVERMLQDPRARAAVAKFHSLWLRAAAISTINKDTTALGAGFAPATHLPLFREEQDRFVDHVVWSDEGTLARLLTAPYTFANQALAAYYGQAGGLSPPPGLGAAFQKVDVDVGKRRGLLTQPGLLAVLATPDSSDPIRRGLFVRTALLCSETPPPPDDVMARFPERDPSMTTRERLAQHRESPLCASCHELLDPVGLGFEHYDAVGRWRDTENGKPIDASGHLTAVDADLEGTFVGAPALAEKLSRSREVQDCVSRQWFRYAFGRAEVEGADACTLDTLAASFAQSGGHVLGLLRAMTQIDAFHHRTNPQVQP